MKEAPMPPSLYDLTVRPCPDSTPCLRSPAVIIISHTVHCFRVFFLGKQDGTVLRPPSLSFSNPASNGASDSKPISSLVSWICRMAFDPLEVGRRAVFVSLVDQVSYSDNEIFVQDRSASSRLPAVSLPPSIPHLAAVDSVVTVRNDLDIAAHVHDLESSLNSCQFRSLIRLRFTRQRLGDVSGGKSVIRLSRDQESILPHIPIPKVYPNPSIRPLSSIAPATTIRINSNRLSLRGTHQPRTSPGLLRSRLPDLPICSTGTFPCSLRCFGHCGALPASPNKLPRLRLCREPLVLRALHAGNLFLRIGPILVDPWVVAHCYGVEFVPRRLRGRGLGFASDEVPGFSLGEEGFVCGAPH